MLFADMTTDRRHAPLRGHFAAAVVLIVTAPIVVSYAQTTTTTAPAWQWTYNAFADTSTALGRSLYTDANWGYVAPACDATAAYAATGAQVSPVELVQVPVDLGLRPLQPNYAPLANFSLSAVANKSLTLIADPNSAPFIYDANVDSGYVLTSIQFYSPSMHALNGAKHDAELVLWHTRRDLRQPAPSGPLNQSANPTVPATTARTAAGATYNMAISLFIDGATSNGANFVMQRMFQDYFTYFSSSSPTTVNNSTAYAQLLQQLSAATYHTQRVELAEMFPLSRSYVTYVGSAMQPPCGGDVRYYLMSERIMASAAQLGFIRQATGSSAYLDAGATNMSQRAVPVAQRGNVRSVVPAVERRRSLASQALLAPTPALMSAQGKGDTPRRFVDFTGNALAGLVDPAAQPLNANVRTMALAAIIMACLAVFIAFVATRMAVA